MFPAVDVTELHPEHWGKTVKGIWSYEAGVIFITFEDGTTLKFIGFLSPSNSFHAK